MLTRRTFLTRTAALTAASLLPPEDRIASDPLRPTFHLLPPHNWMNDPNGPIVWRGNVHLFYQVNPRGADWGDISWGHAVSTDMVHWRHLPVAMAPQLGAPDSYGVFSGSSIADGDRVLAFYTAVEEAGNKSIATLHGDKELREQQTVAISSDPMLLHWERQPQPLINKPPLQPTAGFRDPSVWREGDTWYMTVGSGIIDQYGCVLLYRATVPTGPNANWEYLHPLISGPGNGRHTPDTVDGGTMWECPELFPLDGHHVLLYSTERKVFWITGHLNPSTLLFEPGRRGQLDTGAYYAPKSMVGPAGERILWGWIPEKRPKAEYIAAGWAGCMSLPRVLHVDSAGNLRQSVASVVDRQLLTGTAQIGSPSGAHTPRLAARLTVRLPADGSRVVVSNGDAILLDLRREGAMRLTINMQPFEAPAEETIVVYIDGSVVEIFFGSRTAHTVRSYPPLKEGVGLQVSRTGSADFTLQRLTPISPDRLTH